MQIILIYFKGKVFSFLSLFLIGCNNNTITNESIENKNNSYITGISRLSTTSPSVTQKEVKKEEQISTFSTKISQDDASRQKNISLGCVELNGAIVKAGETFSFCNTLGLF